MHDDPYELDGALNWSVDVDLISILCSEITSSESNALFDGICSVTLFVFHSLLQQLHLIFFMSFKHSD